MPTPGEVLSASTGPSSDVMVSNISSVVWRFDGAGYEGLARSNRERKNADYGEKRLPQQQHENPRVQAATPGEADESQRCDAVTHP